MAEAFDAIESHSTIQVDATDYWWENRLQGEMPYADPFLRFCNYYALGKDVVTLQNYEATLPYFPVNLRETGSEMPDYLLLWVDPDTDITDPVKDFTGYDLVYTSKIIRLFYKIPE